MLCCCSKISSFLAITSLFILNKTKDMKKNKKENTIKKSGNIMVGSMFGELNFEILQVDVMYSTSRLTT